jgi:hypothetical protein
VIVNRVWQYHFGRGIVATASDFGKLGEAPTHPELLDFLTAKFVSGGWHLKPLHREIMLSATYRQTARRSRIRGRIEGQIHRIAICGASIRVVSMPSRCAMPCSLSAANSMPKLADLRAMGMPRVARFTR